MAAPGVNPLFPNAPTFDWVLSCESEAMVAGHTAVWNFVRLLLIQNGFGTHTINHDGVDTQYRLLPEARGGFFIINLRGIDGEPPVPLVFSLYGVYLLGFQCQNRWYFFSDADLIGSRFDQVNPDYWKRLSFTGAYQNYMFQEVNVGISELVTTYKSLLNFDNYRREKGYIERCCFRLIVLLPEAWRFPAWMDKVHEIFTFFSSTELDPHGTVVLNSYNDLFHTWGSLCKRLLFGPDRFHEFPPLPRFPQFHMMIPVVRLLQRQLNEHLPPLLVLNYVPEEDDPADVEDQEAGGGDEGM